MRVLVVDQDSAMLEAIVRSLRERFSVDAVTNKLDCLELLRQNTFEVIVAGERLEDGSGLELLGQVAKRWPSVLRIFCADHERLKLLKGRLGPFELFQTLSYPVDPERLLSTLSLAGAARDAQADMSNIQHVVLGSDGEANEPDPFPPPQPQMRAAQPVRAAGRARTARAGPRLRPGAIAAARAQPISPASVPLPDQAAAAVEEASIPAVKRPPVQFPRINRPSRAAPRALARRNLADDSDQAPDGVGIESRAAPEDRSTSTSVATYESTLSRRAALAGIALAAALTLIVLGFKLFAGRVQTPAPSTPSAMSAPAYPPATVSLVASIEKELQQDDFAAAGANVEHLRQVAPSHPRLTFFDSVLAAHPKGPLPATAAASSAPVATSSDKVQRKELIHVAAQPRRSSGASELSTPAGSTTTSGSARHDPQISRSGSGLGAAGDALAPETPPGLSKAATNQTTGSVPASTRQVSASGVVSSAGSGANSAIASATNSTAESPASFPGRTLEASDAASALSSSAAARPAAWQDPPPVIREAKLIRSVSPKYPSQARRAGIEGAVDLDVTVSSDGAVTNATVTQSQPAQTFDQAAVAAVRRWRYDPRYVDGLPAEAHINVHLDFHLEPGDR